MSAPMVRATLDDSKTQTRRAVKVQPNPAIVAGAALVDRFWCWLSGHDGGIVEKVLGSGKCPYGQPGDRLWVREAWQKVYFDHDGTPHIESRTVCAWAPVLYRATGLNDAARVQGYKDFAGPWRPSIHMPRRHSRILLEVVSVRVERLQDISEADAQAEGCPLECMTIAGDDDGSAIYGPGGYIALWESINGAGSWDANPWVWVIEFKRVAP